jgi:hypothetical protein
MRITLPWGRNRDPHLVAFLGCSGVRVFRIDRLRHHPAQFHHGTSEVRPLLLRAVCRRRVCCGMGDGAHSAVKQRFFSFQLSIYPFASSIADFRSAATIGISERNCGPQSFLIELESWMLQYFATCVSVGAEARKNCALFSDGAENRWYDVARRGPEAISIRIRFLRSELLARR